MHIYAVETFVPSNSCPHDLEEENSRHILQRNIGDCRRRCDLQPFKHTMGPISRSKEYVPPVSNICFKITNNYKN